MAGGEGIRGAACRLSGAAEVLAAQALAEFDVAFEEADPFDSGFGRG
jgi:hypothetical protein